MPDVAEEWITGFQALLKFSRGKNSVVDFPVESAFGGAKPGGQQGLIGRADDEYVDVAGGVRVAFGERSVEPG